MCKKNSSFCKLSERQCTFLKVFHTTTNLSRQVEVFLNSWEFTIEWRSYKHTLDVEIVDKLWRAIHKSFIFKGLHLLI